MAGPPASVSGWGRWTALNGRARARPGEWFDAGPRFDAEHKAKNCYAHLHRYYGLRCSYRRVSDTEWAVYVMADR